MKFLAVENYEKMSRDAANVISAQVIMKPDRYFVKSTHVVDLHESTIKANSRFLPMRTRFPNKP